MVTSIENLSPEIQSMAANLGRSLSGQMFEGTSQATAQIQSQTISREMVLGDQATEIRSALGVGQENLPGYLAEATHSMAIQTGAIAEDAIDSLSDLLPIGASDVPEAAHGAHVSASSFNILEIFDELGGLDSIGDTMFAGIDPTSLSQASLLMSGLKEQGLSMLQDGQSSFMHSAKDLARSSSQGFSMAA